MTSGTPNFLRDVQWTTPLNIKIERKELISGYNQEVAAFGSCLAQNIQSFFANFRMPFWFNRDICAHYSAMSLLSTLRWLRDGKTHTKDELYYYKDDGTDVGSYRYFRLRCFGKNSGERCLERMTALDAETIGKLRTSKRILITVGTSFVAHHPETDYVMCTFFGIPTDDKTLRLYDSGEVLEQLNEIHECISSIRGNQDFEIITTLSPQRYGWQNQHCGMDPYIHNSLVKAINRVALHEFAAQHANVSYFPAYEIVMDELRLYESLSNYDHLHVNRYETPGYVSKRFLQTYCSEEVLSLFELMEKMNGAFESSKFRIDCGEDANAEEIAALWNPILEEIKEHESSVECAPVRSRCKELLDRLGTSGRLDL